MISKEEQSQLVTEIIREDGIVEGDFVSASGIKSNVKIELAEVLDRNHALLSKIAKYMVNVLYTHRVDSVVATGGATALAKNVAAIGGYDYFEITSSKAEERKKLFEIDPIFKKRINESDIRFAYVEDVSSTFGTVERSLQQTQLPNPVIAISGWRRGLTTAFRQNNEYRVNGSVFAVEIDTDYEKRGVIERAVPMFLDPDDSIENYIPELEK